MQEASENENNDGDLDDPGKEFQVIVSAKNIWLNFEFDLKIFQTIILHIICFEGKHKRRINSTHINSSKIV